MATITVRLPEEQKRLFMLIAEQQGVSASFILRSFISSFIEGTIAKLIAEVQELTEQEDAQ